MSCGVRGEFGASVRGEVEAEVEEIGESGREGGFGGEERCRRPVV